MKSTLSAASLLAALAVVVQPAERWRLQHFHDEEQSSFAISSLQFASGERGVAAGDLIDRRSKVNPAMLATSDAGRTWSRVDIKETPLSLFFLNDTTGWMSTPKGIWKTAEAGRSWTKLSGLKEALHIHFADENRGWAVGARKRILETSDGGRKWTRIAALDQVKATEEYTAFNWIVFADQNNGMIAGASVPPRRGMPDDYHFPEWMDPEAAERRRQWPSMTIFLETRDGGRSWTSSQTSMFGRISRIRLAPDGAGLGLIEFRDSFEWPSEVFQINWKTGKSSRVFRRKEQVVTDIALLPSGRAYVAAIESPGKLRRSPVPAKLRILKSDNLQDWVEMEVDYRATARRATFAVVDEQRIWVATDTGMILKLERDGQ